VTVKRWVLFAVRIIDCCSEAITCNLTGSDDFTSCLSALLMISALSNAVKFPVLPTSNKTFPSKTTGALSVLIPNGF
jgi:hypothetical protein